jgi:hypothetical protein
MRSGTTSTGEPTRSRTSTNSIPKLDAVGALTLRPLLTRKLVSGRRSRERGRCGARAWSILAGLISARRRPVTVRLALPSQQREWGAYLCEASTKGQGDKGEWRKRSCHLPGLRCPDCGAQIAVPRMRLSSRARSAWRRSASCGAYLCEAKTKNAGVWSRRGVRWTPRCFSTTRPREGLIFRTCGTQRPLALTPSARIMYRCPVACAPEQPHLLVTAHNVNMVEYKDRSRTRAT